MEGKGGVLFKGRSSCLKPSHVKKQKQIEDESLLSVFLLFRFTRGMAVVSLLSGFPGGHVEGQRGVLFLPLPEMAFKFCRYEAKWGRGSSLDVE